MLSVGAAGTNDRALVITGYDQRSTFAIASQVERASVRESPNENYFKSSSVIEEFAVGTFAVGIAARGKCAKSIQRFTNIILASDKVGKTHQLWALANYVFATLQRNCLTPHQFAQPVWYRGFRSVGLRFHRLSQAQRPKAVAGAAIGANGLRALAVHDEFQCVCRQSPAD